MNSQWTFSRFQLHYVIVVPYYIFFWGSQMTYQVCDWNFHLKREQNAFLYLALYLTAECLISAEFRPLNGLSLESPIGLISPFDLRIILHQVNLDIYIDYLVLYSWGAVDFNPLLLFFIFSIYFSRLINHFVDYCKFYLRWLPMFLRITMRLIINYCFLSWSNDSKFYIVIRFINSMVVFF